MFDLASHSRRRYNALNGEWVFESPNRSRRPWQGQLQKPVHMNRSRHDPGCHLCPRNKRADGKRNPAYRQTFVFTNDVTAAVRDSSDERASHPLLRADSERRTCRVVCYSPHHDQSVGQLEAGVFAQVVDVLAEQYADLAADPLINHVHIFEKRGVTMGSSSPHPHGQIWATEYVPAHAAREQECQLEHYRTHGRSLLGDYLYLELEAQERLVCANEHFVAVVPFWSVWPFETLVISRRRVGSLIDLAFAERDSLADIVSRMATRYDNLFQAFLPYSMGFHQSPTDRRAHPESHLHLHFYPPPLRSAAGRNLMLGLEPLAEPDRDFNAEQAAETLRSLDGRHYRLAARERDRAS
jgi:UDPglucose--hexose-1-phosphate uridylyltransferase